MKKGMLAFAAVLMLAATSCKKDYTCTCDYSIIGDVKTEMKDVKKSDAEDACNTLDALAKIVESGAKCTLD
jgi:hypothetical protein